MKDDDWKEGKYHQQKAEWEVGSAISSQNTPRSSRGGSAGGRGTRGDQRRAEKEAAGEPFKPRRSPGLHFQQGVFDLATAAFHSYLGGPSSQCPVWLCLVCGYANKCSQSECKAAQCGAVRTEHHALHCVYEPPWGKEDRWVNGVECPIHIWGWDPEQGLPTCTGLGTVKIKKQACIFTREMYENIQAQTCYFSWRAS